MQRVFELVKKVAPSNASVVITGESGTGKEVVARAIHNLSPRKEKPFVALNCSAIPATLIESELFGYERGAFTGADQRRLGNFELAHNGTLFLDEIGELPLELQAKFLRVLEERKIRRLGGRGEVEVDVRVICATNRDLKEEIRRGRFREDLFFRLHVFTIAPPAAQGAARGHPAARPPLHREVQRRDREARAGRLARRPRRCSRATPGRGTSASSATPSSAR